MRIGPRPGPLGLLGAGARDHDAAQQARLDELAHVVLRGGRVVGLNDRAAPVDGDESRGVPAGGDLLGQRQEGLLRGAHAALGVAVLHDHPQATGGEVLGQLAQGGVKGLGAGLVVGRRVQLHPGDDPLSRGLMEAIDRFEQGAGVGQGLAASAVVGGGQAESGIGPGAPHGSRDRRDDALREAPRQLLGQPRLGRVERLPEGQLDAVDPTEVGQRGVQGGGPAAVLVVGGKHGVGADDEGYGTVFSGLLGLVLGLVLSPIL